MGAGEGAVQVREGAACRERDGPSKALRQIPQEKQGWGESRQPPSAHQSRLGASLLLPGVLALDHVVPLRPGMAHKDSSQSDGLESGPR